MSGVPPGQVVQLKYTQFHQDAKACSFCPSCGHRRQVSTAVPALQVLGDAWGHGVGLAPLLHDTQGCCVSIAGRKSILGAPTASSGLCALELVSHLIQAGCHVLPERLWCLITNTCAQQTLNQGTVLAGRGFVSAWEQPLHLIWCEMIQSRTSPTLGMGLHCQCFTLPIDRGEKNTECRKCWAQDPCGRRYMARIRAASTTGAQDHQEGRLAVAPQTPKHTAGSGGETNMACIYVLNKYAGFTG